MGTSNEVSVSINGIEALALLDTGSTVTTISREFYDSHLAESLSIHPLNDILVVECADGGRLPYDGYVELDITVTGLPVGQSQTCLALVVPKSNYNTRVPVLIGTNLLSTFLAVCKEEYGERLLQTAGLFTPWYLSFRCLLLRDRELRRRHDVLGYVRSAEARCIVLQPNSSATIAGFINDGINYHPRPRFCSQQRIQC